ncbi:Transcriptional regulator of nonfermentable carbon utilization [Mortierella sp. GBA39]|nr:Transcriptional regulator of nonfermentable carbon utilization [Mortierella sp. GBA39]
MAATATISSSTTLPVVGRSTMSLVGASTLLGSAASHLGTSLTAAPGQTIAGSVLNSTPAGTSLSAAATSAAAAGLTTASSSKPSPPVSSAAVKTAPSTPAPAVVTATLLKPTAPAPPSIAKTTTAAPSISATLPTTTTKATGAGSSATAVLASTPIASVSTPSPAPAPAPVVSSSIGEATTFFDDMINAPQPPANILTLSPTTSLPDLYHDFFDNHPELYDSDYSSDPEMDLDMEDDFSSSAMIRARTMADIRQTTPIQVSLIADRPKVETVDTINLMQLHQNRTLPMHNHNHNRNGTVGPNGQVSSDDCSNAQPTNNRRKKASRACFHCQKAHLTCDDARPCQRCVKRDLAGSCTDGVRKKAKYLQESQQRAAEQAKLEQQQQQAQTTTITRESPLDDAQALFGFPHVTSSITTASLSSLSSLTAAASVKATSPLLPLLSLSSPTNSRSSSPTLSTTSSSCISSTSSTSTLVPDYGFESEALNLEYSILSTMLSSPTAELQSMTSEMSMVENWQRQGALEAMANTLQQQHQQQGHLQRAAALSHNHNNNNGKVNITTNNNHQQQQLQQQSVTGLFGNQNNNINSQSNRVSKRKFPSNTPENVYANTKAPFNYTEGFHYLLRYVRERMDKEEMMRVCRAMAMFRPSFIALIMNLTPEDLIFMETCFQRTVLEFEKLISFSGTPTVVWRRTGEIALVGKEFSLLTQWSRDQIFNKKTYIYELMDNQSAVEYWEKFSTHAFENTEQTVMTTCILLSPTQRVVPCTFCFTIKRDIFDIPLAIVGNFLPILS